MFEEKFPIDVHRFVVLLVQNDGIVFNTQFELNFLLRKNYEGQLQPDVKNSLRIVSHNHHKIMSRVCAFIIIRGRKWPLVHRLNTLAYSPKKLTNK